MARLDLTGTKYGYLTALKYTRTNPKNKMSYWLCKCSCGKEVEVSLGNLRSCHTKSCGCEKTKRGKDNPCFLHGMRNTKPYKSWCKIKERCYNQNDISYKDYGANGITMSEEFRNNFISFYNEVGDPPDSSSDWSIDRIDNNLGYQSGNLRWASSAQQARNKQIRYDNTTGVTGDQWYNGKSSLYAVATWYFNGKACNKKFNTNKYGLLPAFAKAVAFRKAKIEELNSLGYGYTENHGK